MYIPLLLFFISLGGIITLVTRKILSFESSFQSENNIELEFDVPDLDEIKNALNKKIKKYGYTFVVFVMRLYLLLAKEFKKIIKYAYLKINNHIRKILGKKNRAEKEIHETSKFIKTITEYKHKIQKIKHKIQKEEGIK